MGRGIVGGFLGGFVGGPIGILAGLKVRAVIAATASTAGIVGGAFLGHYVNVSQRKTELKEASERACHQEEKKDN